MYFTLRSARSGPGRWYYLVGRDGYELYRRGNVQWDQGVPGAAWEFVR